MRPLFGLFLLLINLSLRAQPPENIRFRHFTEKEGMPGIKIMALFQDSKGFLWVGTQEGLYQYDGHAFTHFYHIEGDSTSLSNNVIRGIVEGPDGYLWIATWRYLCRMDPFTGKFKTFEFKDPNVPEELPRVESICLREDGKLWVGGHLGLMLFDPQTEQFQIYPVEQSGKKNRSNYIFGIKPAPDGTVWVSTWSGFAQFDPSKGVFYRYPFLNNQKIPYWDGVMGDTHLDGKGNLWLCTWNAGLGKYELNSGKLTYRFIDFDIGEAYRSGVLDLEPNADGTFWLASNAWGLLHFDPASGQMRHYDHDPNDLESISSRYVNCLLHDRFGGLWIGTTEGLDYYDEKSHVLEQLQLLRPSTWKDWSDVFLGMGVEQNGCLWIKGFYDTYRLEPFGNTYKQTFAADLFDKKFVKEWTDIRQFPVHGVTAGMEGGVIVPIDKSKPFQRNNYKKIALPGCKGLVQCWTFDEAGGLWATNNQQLFFFDPNTRKTLRFSPNPKEPDSLFAANFTDMKLSRDGRFLWLVCHSAPICKLDIQENKIYRFGEDAMGIPLQGIGAILEDREGDWWFATEYNGLLRYHHEDGHFSRFTEKNNLPSAAINTIVLLDDGRILAKTNAGLSIVDPKANRAVNFGSAHGLKRKIALGCFAKLAGGDILLAMSSQLIRFDPNQLREDNRSAPAQITGFSVFGALFPDALRTGEAHLAHQQNYFSVEFAAANFIDPEKTQFAYRLDGIDTNWIYCGDRRAASYANLREGSYTFRVRAANFAGVWNPEEALIKIVISPPYWRTWWFYTLCILTVGGAAFGFYYTRQQRAAALERLRQRIARDLHDDIGSALSSISIASATASANLDKDPSRTRRSLERIGENARNMIENMQDIIWAIKPDQAPLPSLVSRMRQFANETLPNAEVAFEETPDLHLLKPDMVLKRDIYLVFKEIINNTAKYASANNVNISLARNGQSLLLTITDNGVGFDPETAKKGNGLRNIQERANQHGGKATMSTEPGKGTKWVVVF